MTTLRCITAALAALATDTAVAIAQPEIVAGQRVVVFAVRSTRQVGNEVVGTQIDSVGANIDSLKVGRVEARLTDASRFDLMVDLEPLWDRANPEKVSCAMDADQMAWCDAVGDLRVAVASASSCPNPAARTRVYSPLGEQSVFEALAAHPWLTSHTVKITPRAISGRVVQSRT